MLVDSHCHLNYDSFDEDREAMYQRAKDAGVKTMLSICAKLEDMEHIHQIALSRDDIYASVGIHPHDADTMPDNIYDYLIEWCQKPKVIAIGETGLDYYYEHSDRAMQKTNFIDHIRASRQTQLPLIVHTRDADEDTVSILKDEIAKGAFPFLIHCFSSSAWLAEECLKLGGYISISGIVTFKKATELQDIVKTLPLNKMLVETDSPYLAPIPHRGKRNEPSFVKLVATKVAELKGISLQEVADTTTDNFFELFKKAEKPKQQ
jgi:TatD DNase family protein